MRRVLIILWLVLLGEAIAAQQAERGTFLTHYIFPAFKTGEVHKKGGEIVKASLNYNTLTDEFVFDQNGQKLALDHLEDIERVEVESRSFIPVENGFYEVVVSAPVALCIQYHSDILPPGNETGFGKSQAGAITNVTDLKSIGMAYLLQLPSDYKISLKRTFWLKDKNKFKLVKNAQDVKNVFINKKDDIITYLRENKVNFKSEDDLIKLVEFCNRQ